MRSSAFLAFLGGVNGSVLRWSMPSRIRISLGRAVCSLCLRRWIAVGIAVGAGLMWMYVDLSRTPSTGTHCSVVVYGWTKGAFVRLSTDAGLAYSSRVPYVQCLTQGCSSWLGAEVVGVAFLGPCRHSQGRWGHLHRDMAPISCCTHLGG